MKWTKYHVRKGKEAPFVRLPEGEEDVLEPGDPHDVVTLAYSYCECSLVDAYKKGDLVVHVVGDVADWATTDLSDHEQEPWATNVVKRYYPFVLRDDSDAKVNSCSFLFPRTIFPSAFQFYISIIIKVNVFNVVP